MQYHISLVSHLCPLVQNIGISHIGLFVPDVITSRWKPVDPVYADPPIGLWYIHGDDRALPGLACSPKTHRRHCGMVGMKICRAWHVGPFDGRH